MPIGTFTTWHAAGFGFLCQLTGDKKYADPAKTCVQHMLDGKMDIDNRYGWIRPGTDMRCGSVLGAMAYAYDFCYDAWPAAFRARVNAYLVKGSYATALSMGKFSSCANTHPCSNYYSPIVGGGSMMALGFYMDPGGEPAPPVSSKLLEPAALEDRPGPGVPVAPLREGRSPAGWLWSGLVYLPTSPDELVDAVRSAPDESVREGRVFQLADTNFTFHTPPAEVQRNGVYPWGKVNRERPDCANVGMVLYTVFENVRDGYYKVLLPVQGSTHCSINGVRLIDRSHVRLRPGLYPLLPAYTGAADMVVPVNVRFDFVTENRKEADILLAEAAAKAWGQKVVYELDMAEHKATGMDGWKVNVFGQTLTPYPDITHSVVRHLGAGLLVRRGKRGEGLSWQSFNGGNYNGNPYGFTCSGFIFTPEEYKPALLWLWNRMAGVDDLNDPESYVKLMNGQSLGNVIHTFVNYPLDYRTGLCSIEPGPVRGLRAVAVDYSGKCGAPALFAFVDRIEGGPDRYWLWHYPRYRPKGKAETRVTMEGNTFTVQHADASLRAVFIAPGDAAPEAPCLIKMQDLTPAQIEERKKKRKPGAPEPGFAQVPLAVKGKPGQSFFVVMTMQRGPAPEVKVVSGEGLDSVVDVGGQKVRFDGENVLIGDGPKEINRGNPLIRLR